MRNILEATNTYNQRKTNSFSGKTATNRHPLSGNDITGNASYLFLVAILTSENNTATYFNKASGFNTPDCLISCISNFQVKSRPSKEVEFICYLSALKIKTSNNNLYSGATTACCRSFNTINNIDCIITPESILKHEKKSVNQVTACALEEVPGIPDYPSETHYYSMLME